MSALVTTGGQPPAPLAKPTPSQDRRAQATQALAGQRDRLEAPFRDLDRLLTKERHYGWTTAVHKIPDDLWLPGQPDASARRWLEPLPSADDLAGIRARVAEALDAPANEHVSAVSLGLLLNAYPQTKEAREGYYATALHDLIDEGFSPHMVAEACRSLRRTLKFAPAVAELIEAGTKARDALRFGLRHIDDLTAARAAAGACVSAFETPPEHWPEAWWVNALSHYRRFAGWQGGQAPGAWDEKAGPLPGEEGCLAPADLLRQWGYGRVAA